MLTTQVDNSVQVMPVKKSANQSKPTKIERKPSFNRKKSGTPTSTHTNSLHSQLIFHANLKLHNPLGRNEMSSTTQVIWGTNINTNEVQMKLKNFINKLNV